MSLMFYNCSLLQFLDITNFFMENTLNRWRIGFQEAKKLNQLWRAQTQFVKPVLWLLVDLKSGSLHVFERTKLHIYYDIEARICTKKCKNVSLFLNI